MSQLAQDILIRAMVATMMLSMGLGLTVGALKEVAKNGRLIAFALVANFLIMPAVGFGICAALGLSGGAAAGVLLCCCAPGATIGAVLCRIGGGSVAVAVGLLLLLLFTSVILTPVAARFAISSDVGRIDSTSVLGSIMLFQILPLVIGMLFRDRAPKAADTAELWATRAATGFLVAIVVGFGAAQGHLIGENGWKPPVATAIFVCIGLCVGACMPTNRETRLSIAFMSATRNVSLSMLLAQQFFGAVAVMSVMLFALVSYGVLTPVAFVVQRVLGRAVDPEPAE